MKQTPKHIRHCIEIGLTLLISSIIIGIGLWLNFTLGKPVAIEESGYVADVLLGFIGLMFLIGVVLVLVSVLGQLNALAQRADLAFAMVEAQLGNRRMLKSVRSNGQATGGNGHIALLPHHPASPHLLQDVVPASSASKPVAEVFLSREVLQDMHDYITEFVEERGDHLEVGGMFLGEIQENLREHSHIIRVRGFLPAGKNADFQPVSLLMDEQDQERMLGAVRLRYPSLNNGGMFHRHPGDFDRCSSGDLSADRKAVLRSDTGVLLFCIVTRNNHKQDSTSLRVGELKFDFFAMSKGNAMQYEKVVPRLEDAPAIRPEPALVRLVETRGQDVHSDWWLLQNISGIGAVRILEIQQADDSGVWLSVPMLRSAQVIHIRAWGNGALQLFLGNDRAPEQEIAGPWVNPDVGRHIFLSQLVLQALTLVAGVPNEVATERHFAPLIQNRARLVAEVKAMRERNGRRAQLHREGNQLFWTCTVRQSGHSLPIKIVYPDNYPYSPPRIISRRPLAHSPHQLSDNELCWIDSYSSTSHWNPGRDTAVICVNAATRWFACYLVYQTLGSWPDEADD